MEEGFVYTLHFLKPIGKGKYGKAQHYTGWAKDMTTLEKRIHTHKNGLCGAAAITKYVASQPGNGILLAEIRPGSRNLERKLKNQGGATRRCPICKNL